MSWAPAIVCIIVFAYGLVRMARYRRWQQRTGKKRCA